MAILIAAIRNGLLLLWGVLKRRLRLAATEPSGGRVFRPIEAMSPDQLFGCLLSANFALLMHDNFNQRMSALPEARVREVLRAHWGIESELECRRVIRTLLKRFGEMSALGTPASADGADVANGAAEADRLQHDRLSILAWDIQQLAYLVRLGFALGHVTPVFADSVFALLARHARTHFESWKDYSLFALVGIGMRGRIAIVDEADWSRISRTHADLLDRRRSPTRDAGRWLRADFAVQAGALVMSRPCEDGCPVVHAFAD